MVSFFIALILINIVLVSSPVNTFWDFTDSTNTNGNTCMITGETSVANSGSGCTAVTPVADCRNYSDGTNCSKCTTGFGLAADPATSCVACTATGPFFNAVSCDAAGVVVCYDGETPHASNRCTNAPANNCAKALTHASSSTECFECAVGFYFSTIGTCVAGTSSTGPVIPKCHWSCTGSTTLVVSTSDRCSGPANTECDFCNIAGTFMDATDAYRCKPCIEFCDVCTTALATGCTRWTKDHFDGFASNDSL